MSFLLTSVAAASTPLTLTYTVTPYLNGTWLYQFTLTLDNHDGSWSRGQGFGWVLFGDGRGAQSPLSDFIGDGASFPAGPWYQFDVTAGYNNGPSLGRERDVWYPLDVGESITWSGVSRANLSGLVWSSLLTVGRKGPIEGEPARNITACSVADIDQNGYVNGDDFELFMWYFMNGSAGADVDHNGFVNGEDWDAFSAAFQAGC